jgi:tetratricopeptide (TPR) repeat protein
MKHVFTVFSWLSLIVCAALLNALPISSSPVFADTGPAENPAKSDSAGVVLIEGLYSLNYPVSTKNDKARAYFNQGLALTYGFDHADAEVSFLEAIKHDTGCAMAYWGVAYVLGPNINAPMHDSMVPRAYKMAQKALLLANKVSEKESRLIKALTKRYGPQPVQDRSLLDKAYAEAMKKVYIDFPDDPNIGVLTAEALMDLHPWDYWTGEGNPQPWTAMIRWILEKVVKDYPDHPQGHHLYIHLMENSPTPEIIVRSADVIGRLMPASGHLVHMASHAYYAVGLYHDCSLSNERALGVDKILLASFDTKGLYQLAYVPHVLHFLLACYMMEGRSADAILVARTLAEGIDQQDMRTPGLGTLQHFYLTPYYTLVRFGQWQKILEEAPPADDLVYPRGMYHYARGMAYTKTGETKKGRVELSYLQLMLREKSLDSLAIWDMNKAINLLAIAYEVLAGELAAAENKMAEAVHHFERGVAMEESLHFDEPPSWYFPVRQALGALLLKLGRAEEAEAVFKKDLQKNSENPWSLLGWAQSLKAQGKMEQVPDIEKRFRQAWSRADLKLANPTF